MPPAPEPAKPLRTVAQITNMRGLHARASAKFVETVARFSSEVSVSKDGTTVSGRSIMGLMMLGAGKGSTLELSATGPEAKQALEALQALIRANFHEDQ
jgi:phosphocarrier protein